MSEAISTKETSARYASAALRSCPDMNDGHIIRKISEKRRVQALGQDTTLADNLKHVALINHRSRLL